MRRAARVDANQAAIVKVLERVGCMVYPIGLPFDLLVTRAGKLTLLEVKTEEGDLTPGQRKLIERGWPVHVVRSEEEALRAVGL